jgi:nitroreductase
MTTASPSTGVLDVIRTRRSVPRLKPDPVPHELIAQLIDAAVWAPNHKLTEPWTFYVLEGASKRRFAETRRDFRRTQLPNPDAAEVQPALEKVYRDTAETPVIIVVTSYVADDPEQREEDFWATYGAAYAFMLGAWGHGLGTYFRTGGLRDYPPLRQFLGLPADRRIIGVIYAGYPVEVPQRRRTPAAEKTVWLT